MQYRKPRRAFSLAIALLATVLMTPRDADAAATITVVNLDSAGEGFNDPSLPDPASTAGGNAGATLGEQRLIAFQRAAQIWGRFIDSSVTIRVGANFDPQFCTSTSAVLGSAGPESIHEDFIGAPRANTWYPQALANALRGSDLSGLNDIGATFNSAIGTTCSFPLVWYYGLDADPPANTIDFLTVVLHEIGHGLGFLTFVNLSTGAKFGGLDDTYMLNLENHLTGKLYPTMTNAERVAASTATGNLHWVGPEVVAAGVGLDSGRHPTGHVEMYAPSSQQGGSSVSHFSTSLSPDEMMEPSFTNVDHGPGLAHDLMADIGWSTATGNIASDLSGDRASDIFWRNTSTGGAVAWLMNGFDKGTGGIGGAPTVWQVAGLGDFDGIGEFDVLWRNTSTGATLIWQMNAFRKINSAGIGAPSVMTWQIAGVGDFDADGTTDILWRNTSTGATLIWRIVGLAKQSVASIGSPPLVWQVDGVGDFDGDGTDDILWRNTSNGATLIWRIVGLAKTTVSAPGARPSDWQIAGVGDFDGDETDDILWRNTSTHEAQIWRMVGLNQDSAGTIGNPGAVWQVACVGDYDGAAADILWRNTVSNNTVIWQMDGFTKQASGGIGAPSSAWEVRC